MVITVRGLFVSGCLAAALASSGCNMAPQWQLRQAQLRSFDIYRQSQAIAGQLGDAQSMAAQAQAERDQALASIGQFQQNLDIAQQRIDNLMSEREQLQEKYRTLLSSHQNPLPPSANDRFRELAEKYPEFEFDPETGVSKFNADLLFASGRDDIRPEAHELLKEFTSIMNGNDARQFNILVVGHTDDKAIVHPATRARHETNWELSAHRATTVVRQLAKFGLQEVRMGVAGYSMHQPVASNTDDAARQRNRRVEIYVLAPDAAVAGRDGGASFR